MKQPALRLDTSHVAPAPDNRTTLPAYVQYQQHLARLEALPPHQAPQLAPPLPPAVPPRSDVWGNRAPSAQYVHPVPHNNQTIQYRASPYHGTQSHHRHPSVRLHPPAFNPQQDLARDMDRTPYLQPPPPPPPPPKPGSIWSSRTPGVTSSASTAAEKDRQVMAEQGAKQLREENTQPRTRTQKTFDRARRCGFAEQTVAVSRTDSNIEYPLCWQCYCTQNRESNRGSTYDPPPQPATTTRTAQGQ
jgi:hypothetical protein